MMEAVSKNSGYAQNSKNPVNQIDLTTFWKKKTKDLYYNKYHLFSQTLSIFECICNVTTYNTETTS